VRAALRGCNKTNLLWLMVVVLPSAYILLTVCDGPGKRRGW
jgi:hypothetical protein